MCTDTCLSCVDWQSELQGRFEGCHADLVYMRHRRIKKGEVSRRSGVNKTKSRKARVLLVSKQGARVALFYIARVGQNRIFYIARFGQNRIYTPYMAVCMVISLLKMPYIRINIWFWPTLYIMLSRNSAQLLTLAPSSNVCHLHHKQSNDSKHALKVVRTLGGLQQQESVPPEAVVLIMTTVTKMAWKGRTTINLAQHEVYLAWSPHRMIDHFLKARGRLLLVEGCAFPPMRVIWAGFTSQRSTTPGQKVSTAVARQVAVTPLLFLWREGRGKGRGRRQWSVRDQSGCVDFLKM